MAEAGCMRDVAVQNLEVNGNTTVTNNLTVNGTASLAGMSAPDLELGRSILETFGSTALVDTSSIAVGAADAQAVLPTARTSTARTHVRLFKRLANLLSNNSNTITASDTQRLFGHTLPTASSAATLGATTNMTGLQTVVLSGTAPAGAASVVATLTSNNAATGTQFLIVFSGGTIAINDGIRISLAGTAPRYLNGGSNIFNGVTLRGVTRAGDAAATNQHLTFVAAGALTINPGSYLYFDKVNANANSYHVYGCMVTTGAALNVTFA
jgi:hypothetical protein